MEFKPFVFYHCAAKVTNIRRAKKIIEFISFLVISNSMMQNFINDNIPIWTYNKIIIDYRTLSVSEFYIF